MKMLADVNGQVVELNQVTGAGFASNSQLEQSRRIGLLERLAEDPSTNIETILVLSIHPEPTVRAAVAENPKAPTSVLLALAADEHPDVRFRLAENPNIETAVLKMLVNDENPYISWRALNTLRRIQSAQQNTLRCAA